MAEPIPGVQESDPTSPARDQLLGRLARDAAVDARNLLMILQAYLERLEERFDDPAFRSELQAFIVEAAGRVDSSLERLDGALCPDER
ncbi:MAG: hypothetical protein JRG92_02960 [Deltaproteobacteria bacterium]|nr:hypothetical protein [Deltaproteobacteria bacterium]MBW2382563.1 hypothetical protein [Deltaproteobacteria bacterium]